MQHRQRNRPAILAAVWAALLLLLTLYWTLGGRSLLPAADAGPVPSGLAGAVTIPVCGLGLLLALALARGRYRAGLYVLAWAVAGGLLWRAALGYLVVAVRLLLGEPLTASDRYYAFGYEPFWLLGGVLFAAAAVRLRAAVPGWVGPPPQLVERVPPA